MGLSLFVFGATGLLFRGWPERVCGGVQVAAWGVQGWRWGGPRRAPGLELQPAWGARVMTETQCVGESGVCEDRRSFGPNLNLGVRFDEWGLAK